MIEIAIPYNLQLACLALLMIACIVGIVYLDLKFHGGVMTLFTLCVLGIGIVVAIVMSIFTGSPFEALQIFNIRMGSP